MQKKDLQHDRKIPMGVSCNGNTVIFSVFLPGVNECKLCIYDLEKQCIKADCGDTVSDKNIPQKAAATLPLFAMESQAGVFTIEVARSDLPKFWGYRYEALGVTFMDPYVRYTFGRRTFGEYAPLYGCFAPIDVSEMRKDGKETKESARKVRRKAFSWENDTRLHLAFSDMILYKLHVRGFTMTAPGVRHKGTYLGVAEKADYLKELGINAVLLMPCVEFEERLVQEQGIYDAKDAPERVNYWGYGQDSCYFVPKASYAAEPAEVYTEFKQMVKKLHQNGIEVLMEMSFQPTDNPNMILDCLRWWVSEYHVDGFRMVNGALPERFLYLCPELSGVKILTGGDWTSDIQDGLPTELVRARRNRMRGGMLERMNTTMVAEYRDGFQCDVRRFVKGDEEMVGRIFDRMLRQNDGRGVINYVADNNGFTLRDLYSYDVKHNEENGENNRDGADYNFSWNCGVEGETRKKKIQKLRLKMQKNALTLLFTAQGVPMLYAGDEFGNSQQGNNNAYCQDNPLGWVSWKEMRQYRELFEFTKKLIALRKEHPVLHNPLSLRGMDYVSCGCPDVSKHGTKAWYPDYSNYSRALGILYCGRYAPTGQNTTDCSIYLAANMHWEPHVFDLPKVFDGEEYELSLVTDEEGGLCKPDAGEELRSYTVPPRSIAIFCTKPVPVRKSLRAGRKEKKK